jgi:hypothetical protein
MRPFRHLRQLSVNSAIVLYCAWNSSSLFEAWLDSASYSAFNSIPFIIWCLPLFFKKKFSSENFNDQKVEMFLLITGLTISVMGSFGDLNFFTHIGLAFALTSLLPWSNKNLFWLLCSISWMPSLNWMLGLYFSHYIFYIQLVIPLVAVCLISFNISKTSRVYLWKQRNI